MKDDFYKQLIEDSPTGYAYHRIICDDAGIPCDYEFIEVNPAFEALTGLKSSDITGKKITGILPDIRKDEFDWIHFYGEIAINGGKKEFEQFSVPLQKWYRVNVYSPQKYYFITHFNDITKEIQNTEEKITMLTSLTNIVFELDENFVFKNVFTSDDSYLFMPRQNIIGRNIKDLFLGELGDRFSSSFEKALISKKKEYIIYNSPVPGNESWFRAEIIYLENRINKKFVASITDITELRLAEEKLLDSEERYDQLSAQSQTFTWDVDETGLYTFVDNAIHAVLGYIPEELIKRKYFWDFCAPEDCDVFKQRALDVFSQKEKIINLENRVLAKDGRAVWLSTSGIPLLKDDGTLIGYRGSDTDITESKILNEKLNISEEKFSKAFHVNPSACGFTDLITGKYIEVNEAFYSLFGFEKDEVIGKNAVELGILTQDALKDLTLAIGKSEKIVNLETNLKTKNGDIRYVLLSADDVYLRGEKCRFTVVNNITELANSKEELLKSKNRYSLLSEQSRIFTWEVDENGLYTFVDNISEIVLGYKPEELINRKYFYDICPPEDREVFKQGALDVFRKKEKFANLENRIQVKDGSIIWVSTNGIPIFKDDGALIGYHGSDTDITERRAAADELRASEEKFRIYTEKAPIAIFISDGMGRLIDVNIAACTMVGLAKEELLKLSIRDFISLENILKSPNYFNEMQSKGYSQGELILQNKEGKQFWILLTTSMIDKNHFIAFCTDITEQKKTEEAIFIEKERSHMTLSSIGDGVISTDKKGNVMMINKAAEELTGWKHEEAFGRPWEEVFNIIDEFTQERCENPNLNMTGKGSIVDYGSHAILISKEGIKKPIENSMAPIMGPENKLIGLVLVFRDISDKKKKQEEIIYLSYHDELTGLYNRRFYEEELKRLNTKRNLPMTIVMADLNGLKLVNDSFGHVMGDELIKKVANVLRKGFRADDIIARLGGDEFVIILPKTDVFEAAQIIKRLISIALKEKVSDFDISISIGYATKNNEDEDILEIFNSAEEHMYRDKLDKSSIMKRNTIDLIMNTICKKNKRERDHSKNVSEICGLIAESMGFDKNKVNQVCIAGLMHDIGKIAINENILNKALIFNDEDWKEIRRHSEIGYRILSSSSEFSEIADYVLEHHERWDGKGYPKGLSGEEISIQARIIAVADPFDAMTSASTYREPLSQDEAIAEILKGVGTQFDPEVARIFIEKVLKKGTVLF